LLPDGFGPELSCPQSDREACASVETFLDAPPLENLKTTSPPTKSRPPKSKSLSIPPVANPGAAVNFVSRAEKLAARGQSCKAARAIENALRQDGTNRDARALRDDLCLLEKRLRRLQRESHNALILMECGFSYLRLDNDLQAVAYLQRAVSRAPQLFLAQVLLGIGRHRWAILKRLARPIRGGWPYDLMTKRWSLCNARWLGASLPHPWSNPKRPVTLAITLPTALAYPQYWTGQLVSDTTNTGMFSSSLELVW
jgi:hypothetical protein